MLIVLIISELCVCVVLFIIIYLGNHLCVRSDRLETSQVRAFANKQVQQMLDHVVDLSEGSRHAS